MKVSIKDVIAAIDEDAEFELMVLTSYIRQFVLVISKADYDKIMKKIAKDTIDD